MWLETEEGLFELAVYKGTSDDPELFCQWFDEHFDAFPPYPSSGAFISVFKDASSQSRRYNGIFHYSAIPKFRLAGLYKEACAEAANNFYTSFKVYRRFFFIFPNQ